MLDWFNDLSTVPSQWTFLRKTNVRSPRNNRELGTKRSLAALMLITFRVCQLCCRPTF